MTLNERFLGDNSVFVSFHFSLCIFCFVLVLTSMHHESLVEVLRKERVASILPVYCAVFFFKKKEKKGDLCTATLA